MALDAEARRLCALHDGAPAEAVIAAAVERYASRVALVSSFGADSAVLLANHGPVVSGPDLEGAIYASEELEETAKIFLLLQNQKTHCLNTEQIDELKTAFKLDF